MWGDAGTRSTALHLSFRLLPARLAGRHDLNVMKPIAAPIVGGMITSTIHVLILVPVFFAMIKGRAIRRGPDPDPDSKGAANETLAPQPQ